MTGEPGVGAALLLGLLGSAGHCVGMCGGVVALLERAGLGSPGIVVVHAGRLTTYSALGALLGALGQGFSAALGLRVAQGALSLLAALAAAYFALVLWGQAPSPDRALPGAARRWRRLFGKVLSSSPGTRPGGRWGHAAYGYAVGLLWGLLPCGLVWMALPLALASGSPTGGALTMAAFGLGTLPALALVRFVVGKGFARWAAYRRLMAIVVLLLGVQLALRALAAWGLLEPLRVGGLRLW